MADTKTSDELDGAPLVGSDQFRIARAGDNKRIDADAITNFIGVAAAITAHEGAANPHPTYLTQAEGDAAYAALANAYSDEKVDDRVAALIQNGTGITWSYNDGAGTLTPDVSITQYTDEMAQDAVGAMVDASLTYVDGTPLLQRAALTGDVTAAAGSNGTTIANDAVTFAKQQNIATDSLVGRDTAATGDPENILLNATLSMDGAGNLQRAALTGDVTASAGSNSTTIANDAVTFAKMQNAAASSKLIGSGDAGAGADLVEITLGSGLAMTGTTLSSTGGASPASTTEVLTGTDAAKFVTPDSLAALWEQGANIASAATISIAEGGYFHITGTTGITDIDFAVDKTGRGAWLVFDAALTITHNATTLILPTGANITTVAGDAAYVVSEGADAVRVVAYIRKDGTPLALANNSVTFAKMQAITDQRLLGSQGGTAVEELTVGTGLTLAANSLDSTKASTTEVLTGTDAVKAVTSDALAALWEQGSDIASAGTITVGEGGYFAVTGTTTITDIDPGTDKAGRHFWLKFTGALTITHNASTLIIPGAQDIATAANAVALFVSEGADVVRMLHYNSPNFVLSGPSQAEVEAEVTTRPLRPGDAKWHPGVAKCWGKVGIAGGALDASYNIASVTDGGVGLVTFTIGTDFSSANWAFSVGIENIDASIDASTDVQIVFTGLAGQAAGTLAMVCGNASGVAAVDPTKWHMIGFGDFA